MKTIHLLFCLSLMFLTGNIFAQNLENDTLLNWENQEVLQIGQEEPHATFFVAYSPATSPPVIANHQKRLQSRYKPPHNPHH